MKQFYRVVKKSDNKPIEWNGKECHYSRGEAAKKARNFDGTIEPLSDEQNYQANLNETLQALRWAFVDVVNMCSPETVFNDKYPFHQSFKEISDSVIEWVSSEVD